MRVFTPADAERNADLKEKFLAFLKSRDLSVATLSAYNKDLTALSSFLIQTEGFEIAFTGVDTHHVQAFRRWMHGERKLKPATTNRRLLSLRRFFDWLKDRGDIGFNPCETIRFIRQTKSRRPSALLEDEIHRLLTAAGRTQHGLAKRNYALAQLMLQAGLRVGEVVSLQFSDITLSHRRGEVTIRSGKGRRYRTVPLNSAARRALRDYMGQMEEPESEDLLFRSKRGTPLALRSVEAAIQSLGHRAGISRVNVSPHVLRHTFAINFLQAHPGQLDQLAALLGHESLDTTAIYTRVSADIQAKSVETMPHNDGDDTG